jgi:hypothetical protein
VNCTFTRGCSRELASRPLIGHRLVTPLRCTSPGDARRRKGCRRRGRRRDRARGLVEGCPHSTAWFCRWCPRRCSRQGGHCHEREGDAHGLARPRLLRGPLVSITRVASLVSGDRLRRYHRYHRYLHRVRQLLVYIDGYSVDPVR